MGGQTIRFALPFLNQYGVQLKLNATYLLSLPSPEDGVSAACAETWV